MKITILLGALTLSSLPTTLAAPITSSNGITDLNLLKRDPQCFRGACWKKRDPEPQPEPEAQGCGPRTPCWKKRNPEPQPEPEPEPLAAGKLTI